MVDGKLVVGLVTLVKLGYNGLSEDNNLRVLVLGTFWARTTKTVHMVYNGIYVVDSK